MLDTTLVLFATRIYLPRKSTDFAAFCITVGKLAARACSYTHAHVNVMTSVSNGCSSNMLASFVQYCRSSETTRSSITLAQRSHTDCLYKYWYDRNVSVIKCIRYDGSLTIKFQSVFVYIYRLKIQEDYWCDVYRVIFHPGRDIIARCVRMTSVPHAFPLCVLAALIDDHRVACIPYKSLSRRWNRWLDKSEISTQ